jgi:hypothetical protein
LVRYGRIIRSKDRREIILLKALPCRWGHCSFCNYIEDNSVDIEEINRINKSVIQGVTGEFGVLEVINSGSCFELPDETLKMLQKLVAEKDIRKLYFESHWIYRHKLNDFRSLFPAPIVFITGIETFDDFFRNQILKKGVQFKNVEEIKQYFDSICIMVGMVGQTKEMIANDVKILIDNFDHGTVNLFVENGTEIKPDFELQSWFKKEYGWLEQVQKIDVLWKNTDFGVGTVLNE